jgi:hypothetical protein
MSTSTPEIAALKDRISNLELALHGLYVLLKDLQPMATQVYMDKMMREYFDASRKLGGFETTHFVG